MSGNQVLLFVIVGRNEPLYEAEFHRRGSSSVGDATTRQNYFVLHSSLDLVERAAWTTNRMHLGVIDKVNNQQVSTFLTAGNVKFMLLHSGRSDDSIRNFFQDVYELYVKVSRCFVGLLGSIQSLIFYFVSNAVNFLGGRSAVFESLLPLRHAHYLVSI